jgi:hypothetical protein
MSWVGMNVQGFVVCFTNEFAAEYVSATHLESTKKILNDRMMTPKFRIPTAIIENSFGNRLQSRPPTRREEEFTMAFHNRLEYGRPTGHSGL